MTKISQVVAVLAVVSSSVWADTLSLSDAFSRATPGKGPGVAYVTIKGGNAADRLVSASSPRAAKVELHTMTMDGNVMRMRQIDAVDVPAGGTVEMAPGKPLHLMLMGLTAPLKAGEQVSLRLHFEQAGDKMVSAVVGSPGQAKMPLK